MIYVTITLSVSRKDLQEVLDLLRPAVGMTLTEPGNRSCRLWAEVGSPGNVLLHEEWESPKDVERHFRSSVYRRILAAMEMSTVPPEVRFVLPEHVRGIDWVERVCLDETRAPGT
jgi:quinol monooxygenase YgiN